MTITSKINHLARAGLLAGTALLLPQMALAQARDSGASATQSPDAGEIVVTALRRDTRLQDTPLAISAVTGDNLIRGGNTSFTDLTRNTPSMVIAGNDAGSRRVIIRGVRASGEPTVGVYYDDAPVSGSVSTTSDSAGSTPDLRMFDVERAEVLRGPQGTLYGGGSMGGTIRIIYEKPRADRWEAAFNGNLMAAQGGTIGGSLDGMLNMPIVEDKLAIRVVGSYNEPTAYIDNIHNGQKNINRGHSFGGRFLIRAKPTERMTIDLNAYYEKVDMENGSRWTLTDIDGNRLKRFQADLRSGNGIYDVSRLYSGTLNYDLDFATLTAVTSYYDRYRVNISDTGNAFNHRGYNGPRTTALDPLNGRRLPGGCGTYYLGGTGADNKVCSDSQFANYMNEWNQIINSSLYQPQTVKTWSNELRLSSAGSGPFNWTVGVFTQNRKTMVRSTLLTADPKTAKLKAFVPANIFYDRTINDTLNQKAAFVELSYKLFDKLTLTTGARYYNYDRIVGGRVDQGQIHYASSVTPYSEVSASENGVVGKFNVAYEVNSDIMVYAQAAQGFRPGGANQAVGLPSNLSGYKADSLWNYEVGAKTKITRGLYFNVTGYLIDWSNMQVSGRTAGTGSVFGFIANAGKAQVKGLEVELNATPFRGLSLSGNLGYVDAKLTEDQVSSVLQVVGRKGDRFPGVSKINLSGQVEYTWPVNDDMEGLVRFDASYRSGTNATLSRNDQYYARIGAYGLVNFRTGVQAPDNSWAAYIFINNLFDTTGITDLSASSNSGGIFNVGSLPPRTFGINLVKRFR